MSETGRVAPSTAKAIARPAPVVRDPQAATRKRAQALAVRDDGGRVSRCWIGRRLSRDVAVELLQLVVSRGGEDDGVGHHALAEVNLCTAASLALTPSTLTVWDGSDLSAS
jgi:hypothetical protein